MFVNHYSDFTYVHLISKLDAEVTVEAKLSFENICDSYVVKSFQYHADIGIFDTKKIKEVCNVAKQTLNFCGVNAHHQNGKTENRIKDVAKRASTYLLHAAHLWLNPMHASLWPYDINNYVNLRNSITTNFKPENFHGSNKILATYDSSPLAQFYGYKVEANL